MSRRLIILSLLLIICITILQAQSRYIFYENFEGVYYPPGGWVMNSSNRVELIPHGGRYDVEMNSDSDYMITPLLSNLNSISFWHKNYLADYQFTLSYAYNVNGPWTLMPGYPMQAGTVWQQEIVSTEGLNNIYLRWMPLTTIGSKSILIDDVEFDIRDDQTPVELSSFTATCTTAQLVSLTWVTQSETNHMGYFVFRNDHADIDSAMNLNVAEPISFGAATGTQITYNFTDGQVETGHTYYYWLQSVDLGGQSQYFGPIIATVTHNQPPVPAIITTTTLLDAYPNPFNPCTTIPYYLDKAGSASIDIYNLRGELIWSHSYDKSMPGYYKANWDGNGKDGHTASSGVYYYKMTSGKYTSTKKMVIMK